jgi:uncharacterized protein YkwD
MRFAAALLALAGAAGAIAAAPVEERELLAAASRWREQGCRGNPGTAAPLHWSAALSRGAGRMAGGENALPALEREGYRATRVFHSNLVGYRSAAAAADALAQHYCADLVDPHFTDLGAHRDGTQWTIVMAAHFQLPRLADARAAARRVLELVNEARSRPRRCGERAFAAAPPLRWNERLAQAAAEHAQDMAAHARLDHQGHDGSTPAQRISRTGYPWRSIAENVAAGQASPEDVVEDWLASPGHCANIMDPGFADMGVAFGLNMQATAAVWWAQEFGRTR